jgi:hypothetical protein
MAVPAERKLNLRVLIRENAGYGIIAVSLILLVALDPRQFLSTIAYAGKGLLFLSPLLIVTFGLNAYLKAADANNAVMGIFGGRTAVMIVASTLLGALSPLCSCTVVPMIAVLLQAGIALGPIMAFWMASPLVAPETYAMTGAVLGFPFATARLVTAILVGLLAGFATAALQRAGFFKRVVHPRLLLQQGGQTFSANTGKVKAHWKFWTEPERRVTFRKEFLHSANLMTTWLIVAFLLESLMIAYVPGDAIVGFFGTDSAFSIPVAALAGMPVYINGVAAIPMVKAFVHAGMSQGAALAFIVGGSATSLPAMMAVLPLVRKPVFIWYLIVAWSCAILSGYAYQAFLSLTGS